MAFMRTFMEDMNEQPAVLNRIADYYDTAEGAALLKKCRPSAEPMKPSAIIFSGMGSSYAASKLACAYLWSHGMPAMAVEASDLLHYGQKLITAGTMLVLISQSGESAEIVQLLQLLQQLPEGPRVIGITNETGSTLGAAADVTLPLLAGEESTTSSKTYIASLAVTLLVCGAMIDAPLSKSLASIMEESRKLTELPGALKAMNWNEIAGWLQKSSAIYLIGRGPAVASTLQGALTFKELVKVQAEPMEAAQFRHGPLETVDERTLLIVFASEGATRHLMHAFVPELIDCGARVILIENGGMRVAGKTEPGQGSGPEKEPSESHVGAVVGKALGASSGQDEFFSVLADIYPVQLMAHVLAERLGTSGAFKWITKVTRKE